MNHKRDKNNSNITNFPGSKLENENNLAHSRGSPRA